MSKRRGDFVTLDDLLDEIGVDATRFFMLQRSHDRTVELDLELARRRIGRESRLLRPVRPRPDRDRCSAGCPTSAVAGALAADADWGGAELEPAERALVMALAAFPDEVAEAADRRAPHRIAAYALELAQEFTAFYRDCKVVGRSPRRSSRSGSRCRRAAQQTIALALGLLGVSAPDSM